MAQMKCTLCIILFSVSLCMKIDIEKNQLLFFMQILQWWCQNHSLVGSTLTCGTAAPQATPLWSTGSRFCSPLSSLSVSCLLPTVPSTTLATYKPVAEPVEKWHCSYSPSTSNDDNSVSVKHSATLQNESWDASIFKSRPIHHNPNILPDPFLRCDGFSRPLH